MNEFLDDGSIGFFACDFCIGLQFPLSRLIQVSISRTVAHYGAGYCCWPKALEPVGFLVQDSCDRSATKGGLRIYTDHCIGLILEELAHADIFEVRSS